MKRFLTAFAAMATCVLFGVTAFAQTAPPSTTTTTLASHTWVVLLSGLVATWYRALKDDVTVFPNWSLQIRGLVVGVMGILAGVLDVAAGGGNWLSALLTGLTTSGPALVMLVIEIVQGKSGGGTVSPIAAAEAPKTSLRPPPGYSAKLVPVIAIVSLALAGCGATLHEVKGAVTTVTSDIITDAQDGKQIVDALHSTAEIFFLLHADPANQAKVEQVFADVDLAIDAAIRAASGANSANDGDYNLAFAQFRVAYDKLIQVLQNIGVVSTTFATDKFSVARGGGGLIDMPIPRAVKARGAK